MRVVRVVRGQIRLDAVAAVAVAVAVMAACAPRTRPYRFAAPMLAGAELPDDHAAGDERAARDDRTTRDDHADAPARTHAEPSRGADTALDLAALPAPRRAPRPRAGQPAAALAGPLTPLTPAAAFALAGVRDGRAPLDFALDLRARLVGDRWDAADGPALVDAARTRELLAPANAAAIRPGALLVFDRAVLRAPASLVAVALAVDDRGVATMIFLAAGVARIGYVDPTHPAQKRDAAGRVLNTFLRHRDEEPPAGTRFLAGELLAHVIAAPSR